MVIREHSHSHRPDQDVVACGVLERRGRTSLCGPVSDLTPQALVPVVAGG
jgi:hypothetical protein